MKLPAARQVMLGLVTLVVLAAFSFGQDTLNYLLQGYHWGGDFLARFAWLLLACAFAA